MFFSLLVANDTYNQEVDVDRDNSRDLGGDVDTDEDVQINLGLDENGSECVHNDDNVCGGGKGSY